MSINSVASGSTVLHSQPAPAAAAKPAEKIVAPPPPPPPQVATAPSVNTSGQKIGSTISTSA